MLSVDGLKIYISRGDTGSINVTFTGADAPDDTVVALVVLQKAGYSSESIWEKRIPVSNAQIVIPFYIEDTNNLAYGEYAWILRLLYEDGSVYTPMERYEKFIIQPAGGDITGGDSGE